MEKISISIERFSRMCRLCLCYDVSLIELFAFSSELEVLIADAVRKCASIHVEKYDALPKHICKSCYHQLVKTHQFQTQATQSDNTLRCYLEHLNAADKETQQKSSIVQSKNSGNTPLVCSNENVHTNADSSSTLRSNFKNIVAQDNSCVEPNITFENIAIKCEEMEFGFTHTPIEHPETEFRKNKIIECEETECDRKNHSIDGDETKVDVKNGKIDMVDYKPQAAWINDNSFDLSSNLEVNIKCEPEFDSCFENEMNLKQENELSDTTLASTLVNENSTDSITYEYDHTQAINKTQRNISKPKLHQCDVCNKYFDSLSHLKTHQIIHTNEKPYQCDVCNKHFGRLGHLKTHQITHTDEKPYQCDVCNRRFTQLGALNIHKLVHTGEKPFICDICNKSYATAYYLKCHRSVHTGEKPFQCDVCNKCFVQSTRLKTHKAIHSNVKPYKCDTCSKCFTTLSHLNIHTLTHTGEKPYQCDVCNKCFKTSSHLNRHNLVHTGEKPYQCDVCNKSFNIKSNLTKHERQHTNEVLA